MLISLRPFLNKGTLGYFVNSKGKTEWKLEDSTIYRGSEDMNKQFLTDQSQNHKVIGNKPVAVLIGQRTSSSGEAVAIALESLSLMKFFGESTSGFSSANEAIQIVENEFLIITTSVMANYKGDLRPNGIEIEKKECDEELLLDAVIKWIEEAK